MKAAAHFTPASGFMLPGTRVLAAGFVAVGLIIALLGVVSFHLARTTVNPLRPDAASHLVTSGIYRWTRNPMYLGMLLVLLGCAFFLANLLCVVLATAFVPLMNRLQIVPEERTLAALFGSAFADYKASVRRWL